MSSNERLFETQRFCALFEPAANAIDHAVSASLQLDFFWFCNVKFRPDSHIESRVLYFSFILNFWLFSPFLGLPSLSILYRYSFSTKRNVLIRTFQSFVWNYLIFYVSIIPYYSYDTQDSLVKLIYFPKHKWSNEHKTW